MKNQSKRKGTCGAVHPAHFALVAVLVLAAFSGLAWVLGEGQFDISAITQSGGGQAGTPNASFAEVMKLAGNPAAGKRAFKENCSSCHVTEDKWEPGRIGPFLHSPEFMSLVSDQWLFKTITKGRSGTAMPAWNSLEGQALADLMAWFDTKRHPNGMTTVDQVLELKGDAERGASLYAFNCANCHDYGSKGQVGDISDVRAVRGDGGWGPTLASRQFHQLADDRFIITTILHGRRAFGMPSYTYLPAQEVADILAAVRAFNTSTRRLKTLPAQPEDQIKVYMEEVLTEELRIRNSLPGREGQPPLTRENFDYGAELYMTTCAQCHGANGEGTIGPALFGKEFQETASDEFIINIMAYGRTGSRMPRHFGAGANVSFMEEQLYFLLEYIRRAGKNHADPTGKSRLPGDAGVGGRVFNSKCKSCHGSQGKGGTAPAIGSEHFLSTVSDGYLAGTIRLGRTGGGMRAFGHARASLAELEDTELVDLLSYLRSLSASSAGG